MIEVIIFLVTIVTLTLLAIDLVANFFKKGEKMNLNLKELAKKAIENSSNLEASNEAKKRTAVAFMNRELIESKQYTFDTLPVQEIDETIEEVLNGSK